jgi:hypothetical protein
MHNKLLFLGKDHYLEKGRRFYSWASYYFFIIFGLVICYEPQKWSFMAIEKMHVIYFMHIGLSKHLHLTIGSNLTLIQNEF